MYSVFYPGPRISAIPFRADSPRSAFTYSTCEIPGGKQFSEKIPKRKKSPPGMASSAEALAYHTRRGSPEPLFC